MTKIKYLEDGVHRIKRYRYWGIDLGYLGQEIYVLQEYVGKWWREWKTVSSISATVIETSTAHQRVGMTRYGYLEHWLFWDAYERKNEKTDLSII